MLGQFVIGPLAVCLLVGLVALGLSHASSSSSASPASSAAGAPAAAPSASSAAAAGTSFAPASTAAASATAALPENGGESVGFVVAQTGTKYQQATLAQQVRAQAGAVLGLQPGRTPAPSPSSTASVVAAARTYAPGAQLRGCVLKVTGGVPPEFVDRATYQGTPAYVIASSSHVWVVGLGCTATKPQVVVSLPLAG
jgi:hypothetical protein